MCHPALCSHFRQFWAILGDRGLCYVLRLRRGAVLRVTALGSVCVTCYGFRWELCNTVLRVTAFWVCNTGRSRFPESHQPENSNVLLDTSYYNKCATAVSRHAVRERDSQRT